MLLYSISYKGHIPTHVHMYARITHIEQILRKEFQTRDI